MPTYPGLRAAIAADPEGVRAVFLAMREIRVRPERAALSPPVWAEAAHKIEYESGWKPDAHNPFRDKDGEGASGLIQWMPATARGMGTSTREIRAMSRADQAPLAARYWKAVTAQYRGVARPGDMYVVGAYPVALTYPPERVIAEPGSAIWKQNPTWRDPAAGGAVTVRRLLEIGQPTPVPADLEAQIRALVPELDTLFTVDSRPLPLATSASGSAPPSPATAPGSSATVAPAPSQGSPPPPSVRSSASPKSGADGRTVSALLLVVLLGLALRRSCL